MKLALKKIGDSIPLRGGDTCEFAKYMDHNGRAWILTVASGMGVHVTVSSDPGNIPHVRVGSFSEALSVLRERGIHAVRA